MYTTAGVTKDHTVELTILINKYNADGYNNHFWSAPINNADETKGLSERTSWRVKRRHVVEPLNKPSRFDKANISGTKDIENESSKGTREPHFVRNEPHARKTKPKVNIHKSSKQLAK